MEESTTSLKELTSEIKASGLPDNTVEEWKTDKSAWEAELLRLGVPPQGPPTASRLPKNLFCPYEAAKAKSRSCTLL